MRQSIGRHPSHEGSVHEQFYANELYYANTREWQREKKAREIVQN